MNTLELTELIKGFNGLVSVPVSSFPSSVKSLSAAVKLLSAAVKLYSASEELFSSVRGNRNFRNIMDFHWLVIKSSDLQRTMKHVTKNTVSYFPAGTGLRILKNI